MNWRLPLQIETQAKICVPMILYKAQSWDFMTLSGWCGAVAAVVYSPQRHRSHFIRQTLWFRFPSARINAARLLFTAWLHPLKVLSSLEPEYVFFLGASMASPGFSMPAVVCSDEHANIDYLALTDDKPHFLTSIRTKKYFCFCFYLSEAVLCFITMARNILC